MAKRFQKGVFPWERRPNALLIKDDVGRFLLLGSSKPSCYNLPHDQHVYGKPSENYVKNLQEKNLASQKNKPFAHRNTNPTLTGKQHDANIETNNTLGNKNGQNTKGFGNNVQGGEHGGNGVGGNGLGSNGLGGQGQTGVNGGSNDIGGQGNGNANQNKQVGKNPRDDWRTTQQIAQQQSLLKPSGRNFKSLNKMAITSNLSTAKVIPPNKQFNQFRRYNNVNLTKKKGRKHYDIILPQQQFRYGVNNRPPTPMDKVVGNHYGYMAEIEKDVAYQTQSVLNQPKSNVHRPINVKMCYQNKAHNLVYDHVQKKLDWMNMEQPKDRFKMKRFQKTDPKVNTHLGCNWLQKSKMQYQSKHQNFPKVDTNQVNQPLD